MEIDYERLILKLISKVDELEERVSRLEEKNLCVIVRMRVLHM